MNSWNLYLRQDQDDGDQNQSETQQSFDFSFTSTVKEPSGKRKKKPSKKTSKKSSKKSISVSDSSKINSSKKMKHKSISTNAKSAKTIEIPTTKKQLDIGLKLKSKTQHVKVSTKKIKSVLPFNAWSIGELSEIRCKKEENIFHLILPLLSELSSQNRWITLIAPPANIDKKLFAYHGIDVSRVLLIHPKENVDDTATMNKALKNGTSGIVLIWVENLVPRFVAQWRKSVKQGHCRGVIINHDLSDHSSPSVALSLDVNCSDDVITITSSQMFGRKSSYRNKRSFPIINMDEVLPNQENMHSFCLVN